MFPEGIEEDTTSVTSCFQKLGILLMRGNSEIMLNKTFPLVFVLLSDTSAGNSALHYPNQVQPARKLLYV